MSNGAMDFETEDAGLERAEDLQMPGIKKLVVVPGATTYAASFQIHGEDHTLGNALRYFINKKYVG